MFGSSNSVASKGRPPRGVGDFGYPAQMKADLAAAFCGETSTATFRRNVKRGIYPAGKKIGGGHLMWSRKALEDRIERNHATAERAENIAELV